MRFPGVWPLSAWILSPLGLFHRAGLWTLSCLPQGDARESDAHASAPSIAAAAAALEEEALRLAVLLFLLPCLLGLSLCRPISVLDAPLH